MSKFNKSSVVTGTRLLLPNYSAATAASAWLMTVAAVVLNVSRAVVVS